MKIRHDALAAGMVALLFAVVPGVAGVAQSEYMPMLVGEGVLRVADGGEINQVVLDWNDDGILDLIAGITLSGQVLFFPGRSAGELDFGIGTPLRDSEGVIIRTIGGPDPLVVDWNDDGLLDLLVSANGCIIRVFENVGSPQSPVLREADGISIASCDPCSIPGDGIATPKLIDWNGDGARDLVVSYGFATEVWWYSHACAPTPSEPLERGLRIPLQLHRQAPNIDLADWNGDGLIDILVGYCYLQNQRDGRQGMRGYVYWYENIGLPEFPLFGVGEQLTLQDGTPLDAWESTCPFVVDWTCDGVQDLVVGDGGQGKIYFYTNVGTNREPVLVGTSEYEHGPVRVNESSW